MSRRNKTLTPRSRQTKEAISIQRAIDDVQDSLDRFQVLYEEGGDVDAAVGDFLTRVEDLEDAVDKMEPKGNRR